MSESLAQILIISIDVVGKRMAGPGIRYCHLARVLSKEFPVTLAVPHDRLPDISETPFQVACYRWQDWSSLEPLVNHAKVVIVPSDIANMFPQLAQARAPLVIDGYAPSLAEWLSIHREYPISDQVGHWFNRMVNLNRQYLMGDFFLCASERQRDWWLGLLESNGRINPVTLAEDPSLRSLIDVVPFGLPEAPVVIKKKMIKSVWPGIGPEDKVILWGGGYGRGLILRRRSWRWREFPRCVGMSAWSFRERNIPIHGSLECERTMKRFFGLRRN